MARMLSAGVSVILILLGIFFLLAVLFVAISFPFGFWLAPKYLFRTKVQTRPLTGQPPPPGLPTAMWRELYRAFYLFTVYLLFPFYKGCQIEHGTQYGLPVVFIHGYGVTCTSWWYFLPMLARRGVKAAMLAFQYDWAQSVERSSVRLAQTIEKILSKYQCDQVDLVAHSWGGIVARWYIQKLGMADKVRSLTMVEVPNQGSFSTFYAPFGAPVEQLAIGSETILALIHAPPKPPLALTFSRCDNVAVPWEFLKLPSVPGNFAVCREIFRTGHLGVLLSRQAADFVAERLLLAQSGK